MLHNYLIITFLMSSVSVCSAESIKGKENTQFVSKLLSSKMYAHTPSAKFGVTDSTHFCLSSRGMAFTGVAFSCPGKLILVEEHQVCNARPPWLKVETFLKQSFVFSAERVDKASSLRMCSHRIPAYMFGTS